MEVFFGRRFGRRRLVIDVFGWILVGIPARITEHTWVHSGGHM